jgi:hypothetical protein
MISMIVVPPRRDNLRSLRQRLRSASLLGTAVLLVGASATWACGGGSGAIKPEALPDGVGLIEFGGIANTRIFDGRTNRWTQAPDMHFGRWYPTAVMLPDGKVLVGTGTRRALRNDRPSQQRLTETYDPRTNKWSVNNTGLLSQNSMPLYARMWLMPNGKVFYDGTGQAWAPGGAAADEASWLNRSFFNLRTKQWEVAARLATFRSVPSDVMLRMHAPYDKSTLLISGGVVGPSPNTFVATRISEKVTVTKSGTVTSALTKPLNHGRWASATTVLPTGQVVTFNGADKEEPIAPGHENAVRRIEIFNPVTNTWRNGPLVHRDRTYHNTAVLLPDARVLIGGHAPAPNSLLYPHDDPVQQLTANNDRDPSFEIYSPPYLFRGTRPRITSVQAGVAWGSKFTVRVTCGAGAAACHEGRDIKEVVLSRLPAQTHTSDVNQRTLVLPFRRAGGNRLVVQAPPNGVAAPPGPYYLFVIRHSPRGGIPSVARVVTVGRNIGAAAIEPFAPRGVPTGGSATPTQDTSTKKAGECFECTPSRAAQADPVLRRTLAQKQANGDVSTPFEEGGRATPRCHLGTYSGVQNYILCKPAAQTQIVTPEGRVLYWDGFPGTENSKTFVRDGGASTHNAFTRLLDLRSGHPRWTTPTPEEPPGINRDIAPGLAPDDQMTNDGDVFCSYQVHLADGRTFAPGGTDWYDDVFQTDLIGPLG